MFDNVEYFEAILNYGTLSKAATVLGISQPALSNFLKQLEAKAGATLFERSTSPIVLTETGKIYYKYLKQTEAIKNDYLTEIGDMSRRRGGMVTIGGASSTTACYLSRVTGEFLRRHPESSVKILDGVVSDIARQTMNGEIDFFITPLNQRNSEFEYIRLLDERIFMCVPDSMVTELSQNDSDVAHELESKRIPVDDFKSGKSADRTYSPVNASIFKNSRFILLEDGTNVRAMSNSFFDSWGYYPQMPVEVSQMLTGYQLCLSGAGVTFLPESILKYGNFRDCPVIYAIDDSLSHREMYACSKKSRYISSACQEFIELLKKMPVC